MGSCIDMYMDAGILSRNGSGMPKLPYKSLNGRDVRILTNRGNKFYLVLIPGGGTVFCRCHNAGIIHHFPSPALTVPDTILLVILAVILCLAPKVLRHDLCRFLPA